MNLCLKRTFPILIEGKCNVTCSKIDQSDSGVVMREWIHPCPVSEDGEPQAGRQQQVGAH